MSDLNQEQELASRANFPPIKYFLVGCALLLITTILVGGGVYSWQEMRIKKLIQEKSAIESEKGMLGVDRDAVQSKLNDCTILRDSQKTESDQIVLNAQKNRKEQSIRPENAISWTSGNAAKVNLVRVTLEKMEDNQQLDLYFNVTTTSGGYCWQSMEGYLRVMNEDKEYVNPQKIEEACADGYSVLKNQKVSFVIPATQKAIDIYNRGRDVRGNTAMKKMFSVFNEDEDFRIVGYPQ